MSKHLASPVEPQKACRNAGFLIAYLFVIVPDFSRKKHASVFSLFAAEADLQLVDKGFGRRGEWAVLAVNGIEIAVKTGALVVESQYAARGQAVLAGVFGYDRYPEVVFHPLNNALGAFQLDRNTQGRGIDPYAAQKGL